MTNLSKALRIAEIERKDNPAVIENTEFEVFTDGREIVDGNNIFTKCTKVHVRNCVVTYLLVEDELVAFVEAKDA